MSIGFDDPIGHEGHIVKNDMEAHKEEV